MSQPVASGFAAQPRSSATTVPLASQDRRAAEWEVLGRFYGPEAAEKRAQSGVGGSQQRPSKRKISTTTIKLVPPPVKKRKDSKKQKPASIPDEDGSLEFNGQWMPEPPCDEDAAHLWKLLGTLCDVRGASVLFLSSVADVRSFPGRLPSRGQE